MSLLQMSFAGGTLVLVVWILRALFINKLPRRTFLALWWVVLLRLLLPIAIPAEISAYSLMNVGLPASESMGMLTRGLVIFIPGFHQSGETGTSLVINEGEVDGAGMQKSGLERSYQKQLEWDNNGHIKGNNQVKKDSNSVQKNAWMGSEVQGRCR